MRAAATAVAGSAGEDADKAVLDAVRAAVEADSRFDSGDEVQLRAAQLDAIRAAVRATATGNGFAQTAAFAVKAVQAHQVGGVGRSTRSF